VAELDPFLIYATMIPEGVASFNAQLGGGVLSGQSLANGEVAYVMDDGSVVAVHETPTLEFALEGAWPNPTTHADLFVHFVLPSAEPARLELFDIQGRRLMERGIAAVGRQTVNLGQGARLSPGVYLVRLRQGPMMQTTQVIVLR
jgi:hypothetical protein